MLILEKEMLRLIKEETDKVLQEADKALKEAVSQTVADAIRAAFKKAKKPEGEADKLIDLLKQNPSLSMMDNDVLEDIFKDNIPDINQPDLKDLINKVKGVDAPEPTASMTRGPDADLAADVASDAAEEGIAARKVIDLGDGELIEPGEAIKRVSGVDLKPEQTQQVLAIVKRSDNLPAVTVADDLAKAIDIPEFNTKRALAALAALGVVAGGKIAWDNFGIAAAGEGDVSVGRPVSSPGGEPPASLPPTTAPAGGEIAPGWETYLRGSDYVTREQAMQVHNAWVEYVKSKEANLKEEISEDASFANFVQWWRDNKKAGNLGRWGSWDDTIKHLKSQTKNPEDPEPTVDTGPENMPAPAPAPAPAAPAPAAPAPSDIDKALASLRTALEKQKKLENDAEDRMPNESDPAKKRELQKEKDMARKNIDKLERQIKQIERRAANIAKRADKKIGRLSESVYNRWQKIIKG